MGDIMAQSLPKTNSLNFGCGRDIREGYDNIDKEDFDFNVFPYPIEDESYDYIYSRHVLEHLKYPEQVIDELVRICKKNGEIRIKVPHFNSEGAISTFGHISFFVPYSFTEYATRHPEIIILEIEEVPSIFGMFLFPNWLRNKLSKMLRGIFVKLNLRIRKC